MTALMLAIIVAALGPGTDFEVREMTVTAYCPCAKCCGRYADGYTACGCPITANGGRFVAADRSLPFGAMVSVPGYGTVPVLDRGGAIRGDRIDVFFPTHRQALRWGRQRLRVTVWRRVKAEIERQAKE